MIPLTFFILLPSSFILLTFSARMNSFLFCLYFQASSQVESSQNSVEENFLIPILLRQGFVGHGPESRNSLCPKSSSDPTNKWRTSNLGPICSGIRRCRLFQHCSTTMLESNKVPCGLRKTASYCVLSNIDRTSKDWPCFARHSCRIRQDFHLVPSNIDRTTADKSKDQLAR